MKTTMKKQKTVDQLIVYRARMLLFAAFSFCLWQFGWLVMDMVVDKSFISYQIAGWSSVAGAVCWAIASLLFVKYSKQMKQSRVCSALNDELTIKNRNVAFEKSYFVLLGLVWLLVFLLNYWVYEAKHIVRFIAIVVIILPMVLYSVSELKNGEDEE